MDEMYAYHLNRLGAFIGAAQPGISETRCRDLALQFGAMIEGLMLFSVPRGKGLASRDRMGRLVKDSLAKLLTE
jgi:hypothetical protein